MALGDTVWKYGIDMGKVVAPIKAGEHAHVHNIKTRYLTTLVPLSLSKAPGGFDASPNGYCDSRKLHVASKDTTFLGYRRENGRVGIRNHVIILPLDDLSNAAAEAVAHNIKGALAIPHPYGRLQFGADLDLHFRTLIGAGCNPNVAAVVVIGIEDGWTQKVVEGIADHRQAGGRLRHRGPRRPRHHPARQQGGARVRAVGQREAARGLPDPRAVGQHQVRRERHHQRLRRQPDSRQRLRQAAPAGQLPVLRRNHRAHRRRADRGRALRQRHRCASSSCSCSTATRT